MQASGESEAKTLGTSGALVFDKDAYTELTTTITDAAGDDHEVKYHFYKAITYFTKPVDEKYQSVSNEPRSSWVGLGFRPWWKTVPAVRAGVLPPVVGWWGWRGRAGGSLRRGLPRVAGVAVGVGSSCAVPAAPAAVGCGAGVAGAVAPPDAFHPARPFLPWQGLSGVWVGRGPRVA